MGDIERSGRGMSECNVEGCSKKMRGNVGRKGGGIEKGQRKKLRNAWVRDKGSKKGGMYEVWEEG